jgi:hypothetical protein
MVIEKKRGGEEGVDRDDVEGKRAGNLGSDPGMPQREEQRGYSLLYCIQRECGPEGWLQGNNVTDDDVVLLYGTVL